VRRHGEHTRGQLAPLRGILWVLLAAVVRADVHARHPDVVELLLRRVLVGLAVVGGVALSRRREETAVRTQERQ